MLYAGGGGRQGRQQRLAVGTEEMGARTVLVSRALPPLEGAVQFATPRPPMSGRRVALRCELSGRLQKRVEERESIRQPETTCWTEFIRIRNAWQNYGKRLQP